MIRSVHTQRLEPRVLLTATPVGGEFQVNTFTTGSQRTHIESPKSVAMDSQGNFVVTWESNGQDGSFGGVFAQRYNAAGVAQGMEFQVNTYTTGIQRFSTVAMDAAGNFVVTWSDGGQDGMFDGIYAQRFNAAGVAQGGEFQVNTYTTQGQFWSNVAMDADGDFLITWTSRLQEGGGPAAEDGVYARRYNAAGVAQGIEFLVNTTTTNYQRWSTAAIDADGDFVITWTGFNQDGSDYGIYAQRYDAAGVAQGGEFPVNSYTTGEQSHSTVAMDADGNFVITWTSVGQDGSVAGVYGQRYDAAGMALGGEFAVNTHTTADQFYSSVAMDADGAFVITWTSAGQDGGNNGIYARQYDASGVAQGDEFLVNTYTNLSQSYSSVAVDNEGDFVIAWSDVAHDGNSYGVFAQRYTANQLPNIGPQTFAISENRPIGYVVGTVVASDPDPGQTLTYAITAGDPNAQFAIDSSTGQITVAKATIDFEATPQFNLTVQVTDNGTPDAVSNSATITVNINDLNEAPTFLLPNTFTIAENRSVGFFVGDVNTVDPEGNTVTYSIIGGDPNAQFTINSSTGVITVAKATINFEATPQFVLQVQAQDDGTPSKSRTQNITVNINDLNEAPVFLQPTTFSIAENRSVGYTVGDVNAVDPESQTLTYSIVGGDPNAQFAIDGSTGVITVAKATINFEATPQFVLQVRAQDNGTPSNSRTQNITVNVTDLNEAPNFVPPTTFTIAENRSVGYVVGDVNAFDPEGQALTYSIVGGDPNAQFAINSSTGVITVAKATINFEATPQFVLQVRAQDNGSPSNFRTQNITVNITDLNEAPVFLQPTTFSIAENSPNGTVVGTVNTFDPESQTVMYAITAGNTNSAFAINASSGQITVNNAAALDFETTPQFVLSVQAVDNGSPANSRTQAITINLTDVSGALVARPKSSRPRFVTSASSGTTGQQVLTTSTAIASPAKRTPQTTEPVLYSFTLFEPLAALPAVEDNI